MLPINDAILSTGLFDQFRNLRGQRPPARPIHLVLHGRTATKLTPVARVAAQMALDGRKAVQDVV
jgi:hypothetical protein